MVVNEKPISNAKSILFKPIKLGSIQLQNRIIMSPLTRCRADHSTLVPNKHMVEYYKQRATAGLIITEATAVTPTGIGYWNAPGIWLPKKQIN
jgi:2,4-dienoyl-CoA reductase-like NADH-dependent reductase (Old Yellow Enzyme family)